MSIHKKVLFDLGDKVVFQTESIGHKIGEIVKINPKNAVVKCGKSFWNVPYLILEHELDTIKDQRFHRVMRILEVENQARDLMNHHGLEDWSIEFNDTRKQLGACIYAKKRIVLSRSMILHKSPEQVTDVILHEIAHALAGWDAGHGQKWKAIATRLGAHPRSRAPVSAEISKTVENIKESIKVGDAVTFVDKKGQNHTGFVERKNAKTARVKSQTSSWRVPYRMLNVV